jgi:hypothetical protein
MWHKVKFGIGTLLLFIAIVCIVVALGKVIYKNIRRVELQGVTAALANMELRSRLVLPVRASNVDVYAEFYFCLASFSVCEKDFIEWCHAQGWEMTPITSGKIKEVRVKHGSGYKLQQITEGYEIEKNRARGIYDAHSQRARVWRYEY